MRSYLLFFIFVLATALPFQCHADEITLNSRINAVSTTAKQEAHCQFLGDFYWEIGDQSKVLGSGSIGSSFNANSQIQIASASKLPFAAYVLEKIKTPPTADQIQKMQMSAGYIMYDPPTCILAPSVGSCFRFLGNNLKIQPLNGYFYYSDGHSNKLAMDLGLGNFSSLQLTLDMWATLGADTTFSYVFPDVVGGMQTTPAGYGNFLRKILAGKLRIANYLGSYPVCTQPKTCNTSVFSPILSAWHYSLNHWVEDDPVTGDGAFSSVGLYGFYPWITADKKYYGIIAMQGYPLISIPPSTACGAKLRKAWETGIPVN